jgi:hypothetical protein
MMPFYIKHSDGTSLVTVEDGTVNSTQTSIKLVGKNFPTYGEYLNQNLVNLLENSASATSPTPALVGQLWYDSANKNIKVYRAGSTTDTWQKLATTTESSTEPGDPILGDLWWDSANTQLKLYDTNVSAWRVIGPQTTNNGRLTVTGINTFQLIIGGNPYFTVDSVGGVNMPNNPCVSGYDNTGGVDLTTASISSYNAWKPNITIDRGGNFDQSTGVFTVATSGIYRVYCHVTRIVGTVTGNINLRWRLNNADVNINATSNSYSATLAGEKEQLVCSGIIDATVGDTIRLVYSTDSDATNAISYQNSSYSIQLVG